MSPTTLPNTRKSNKKKGQGRNRRDRHEHEPVDYYRGEVSQTAQKGYDFRAEVIRREKRGTKRVLSLDPIITQINWEDKGPIREATISVTNPGSNKELPVKRGHEVRVRYRPTGGHNWHPLWRLRVFDVATNESTGNRDITVKDEVAWITKTKEDFSYKKGKAKSEGKRPNGWYAHQIARDICRKYGIPVGKLVKGRHRIENLTEEGISPFKAIEKAYELDRDETGRKFILGIWNGKLSVRLMRRSKTMLLLGGHLVEAIYSEGMKASFATVLDVKATSKREKGSHKKIEMEVRSSKTAMRRYGIIRAEWTIDDPVHSKAKARARAKRRLIHFQEPEETLSLSVPGIPTLQRGDAIKVKLRQSGLNEIVYASGVSHTVTAGDYMTEVECQFTDPFEDKEGDKTREKICKEARKKKRREPSFCSEYADVYAPNRTPKKKRRDGAQKKKKRR